MRVKVSEKWREAAWWALLVLILALPVGALGLSWYMIVHYDILPGGAR